MKQEDFIMFPVPIHMFAAVCGVLAGTATASSVAMSAASEVKATAAPTAADTGSAPIEQAAGSETVAGDPNEIDTGGHPWSEALHAGTKGKTKDGYWRMKVGVSRPADLPGFPKADAASTAANPSSENGAASAQSIPAATADDDDEFAAFASAAANQAGSAAAVPARTWTDADLGALCNQAATKLGDPAPIKALIAEYMPADTLPHSRNVPADKRAAFAAAIEAKAGITYAG